MEQSRKTLLSGEISELMETLKEQFEALGAYNGKIPILEIDILKDNIRRLYEMVGQLQKEDDQPELVIKQEKEMIIEPAEPLFRQPEKSEKETAPAEIPVVDSPESEKASGFKEESEKSDLFSSETTAFSEKLMEAREQSLGPRTGISKPVDIKSLISINDKFLFINELFDGDYKEYTHAIGIFGNFEEKREAFDFLDTLLKDNLWNSTSPAFLKLKEIVEKRFI